MNKYPKLVMFALLVALSAPFATTGCRTAPSERVVQVQTLKAIGHTAEAAVSLSAQLYQQHTITAAQARMVMDFYDLKFQPAYRVAVTAVQANLDSVASPELIALAAQLSALVQQFYTSTP